jgi:hypothetical protein
MACLMLESTVVRTGYGAAAVSHLQSLFHTQAGSAYFGDLNSWRHRLASLGIPLRSDSQGSAHATWVALADYRDDLASKLGQVDLSLLADDLEPLAIPDLITGVQVTVDLGDHDEDAAPRQLSLVARRVPRLLVEGLPGAGKSAAMVQLAAFWAGEPDAPLPILVRLKELAQRCNEASDVGVSVLCDIAAAGKPDLAAGFRSALNDGHAVLLLDGLDECLNKAPLITQGLKQALTKLSSEIGVVLTTRPGSATAALRFDWHRAQLVTPQNLDHVLARLLEHVATTRFSVVASTRIAVWIERLRAVRFEHPDIGNVPLLSVLAALTIASGRTSRLPTTTAPCSAPRSNRRSPGGNRGRTRCRRAIRYVPLKTSC